MPYFAGASETADEASTWVAAVRLKSEEPTVEIVANGALIDPNYIIVTANSVDGRAPGDLEVVVGAHLLSGDASPSEVIDIIRHPAFAKIRNDYVNDVALLRLGVPVTGIAPIPLATTRPEVELETTIIGWAAETRRGKVLDHRQSLALPVVSMEDANVRASYNNRLGDGILPLGTLTMTQDACLEQIGAPVVAADQLVGLVSYGDACVRRGKYRLSTDIAFFRPWIQSFVSSSGPFEAWERDQGNEVRGLEPSVVRYAFGLDRERHDLARTGEIQFPTGRDGVERLLETSTDLMMWTPVMPETEDVGDGQMRWRIPSVLRSQSVGYFRLGARSTGGGGATMPVPKPLPFDTSLPGEVMGEVFMQQRDYRLGGLTEGEMVAVRVQSDSIPLTLQVIDQASGEVLQERELAAQHGGYVSFEAPAAEVTYLARVKSSEAGTYNLGVSAPPKALVIQSSLEFDSKVTVAPPVSQITVRNQGKGLLDFAATSDVPWLTFTPAFGSVEAGKFIQLRVAVNEVAPEIQSPGSYNANVSLALGDGTIHVVPVSLVLTLNLPELRIGVSTVGSLEETDPFAMFRPFERGDSYLIRPVNDGRYAVLMSSAVMDTYVIVYDAETNELLGEADDQGFGGFFNAGLVLELVGGRSYVVEATTFGAFVLSNLGPYQILFRR